MALTKDKVFSGLLVAAVIIVTILVASLFLIFKEQDNQRENHAAAMKKLENEAEKLRRQGEIQEALIAESREITKENRRQDSINSANVSAAYNLLRQIEKNNDKITSDIRKYSSPELRRAYAEFQP